MCFVELGRGGGGERNAEDKLSIPVSRLGSEEGEKKKKFCTGIKSSI